MTESVEDLKKVKFLSDMMKRIRIVGVIAARNQTIEEFHEEMVEFTTHIFEGMKTVRPTWHIRVGHGTDNPQTYIVETMWADRVEKHLLVQIVQTVMKNWGATYYALASEAWMAKLKDNASIPEGGVRDMPNREEVVVVETGGKDKFQLSSTFHIVRHAWKVSLGERFNSSIDMSLQGPESTGNLMGLLRD